MSKEALKLALEALDNLMYWDNGKPDYDEAREAIAAIKEALSSPDGEAQPEQEPVAWIGHSGSLAYSKDSFMPSVRHLSKPLYTTPPQRKPLTDEQRIKIVKDNTIQGYHGDYFDAWGIIDDVEAAHGIKE